MDINDSDKDGFMAVINKLDKSKGFDLFLHTPGGETAATESIVDYLGSMFGTDIRAIIPQLAMSAGTMIACACDKRIMGKHSSLGPIDPQLGGIAAHGIIEEFERAKKEIARDASRIPVWQPIIAKYQPALIGECEKAIKWSQEMVEEWLISGMFEGKKYAKKRAKNIIKELGDHALTKSHARHISFDRARDMGLAQRRCKRTAGRQRPPPIPSTAGAPCGL
jgi:Serine dehydrogenase proteinase